MAENEKIETAEYIAHIFDLSLEQARNLVTAYKLSGSCDEGIMGTTQAFGISLETVREVFYALDAVTAMNKAINKEEQDLNKWWKTGEM